MHTIYNQHPKELTLTFTHILNECTSLPSKHRHWQSERQHYLRDVVRTTCGRVSYKHVRFSKPNIVPRRIFGSKRDEVTGEWRKLTHYSGRVTQICVFNTVKLGTSASSP